MRSPISRPPITRMSLPDAGAAPFLRATISRDARGCGLTGPALLNRFPAGAYCSITWFLEGSVELLSCGGDAGLRQPLARCVVGGCQTAPFTSRNQGEVHAFFAMFYPDAFHALFGVDLARVQNRFADAREVLPAHALGLVDAVFAASSDDERRRLIEDFIAQWAHGAALPAWTRMRRLGGRLTLALASKVLGIGPRQLQRVAPRQAGASLQTLARLWRGERSFLRAQRQYLAGHEVDMADHALVNEYADQSHMVRDCKAQTGRTPLQLARDVQSEEADWIYRLEFSLDDDNPPTRPA
ncbi:AraC family transcriptional regulator [Massilia haematophila]|uniref:HTH araC/xylS-type domain-containing protein n=1 Tax=Massilia haematophila TaxID=457923 RepID=A0ABV7PI18_9BURK